MLAQLYNTTRQRTERLCQPLTVEDTVPQFVEYASPPKWHLAHTSWFFEEMLLKRYLPNYKSFDPAYGELFNSYYQTVGNPYARHQRGIITRPCLADVYDYRTHVDDLMNTLINSNLESAFKDLLMLGIYHEQQHQELLLTDIKIAFAQNPTFPVYSDYFDEGFSDKLPSSTWIKYVAGDYSIGHQGEGFCFDNELATHIVHLNNFEISSQLTINSDYLTFIDDGGYQTFDYWHDDGWAWVKANNVQHPMYWIAREDGWHHFTLNGLQPLPATAPVTHVSYYEAHAFATWRGCRLPTEFEWEAAACAFQWGKRWEWTASAYQPYPGFTIGDGAVGEYNGKFMVNQLVLRGASVATAPGHSRASYRNFFHPHHQWQYSGIRLAR